MNTRSTSSSKIKEIDLEGDNVQLSNLCGTLDENLHHLADGLNVKLSRRGHRIKIEGGNVELASQALSRFHRQALHQALSVKDILLGLVEINASNDGSTIKALILPKTDSSHSKKHGSIEPKGKISSSGLQSPRVQPRTPHQSAYLEQMINHDITFGIGPAGTGKTWLAVACAIEAMERETVHRIILTRPAVEAGERLGFLPGDLAQKVDPYLRPLYDALYDFLGFEKVQRLFEKQSIEIAPLAYMRGRTLNHAFIILDEAQNTTPEQMKMFLTRIGFGSKAVITGDPSQVDLPKGQQSGLIDAIEVLQQVQGIATTCFTSLDVVRHPLIARIVNAYEKKSM